MNKGNFFDVLLADQGIKGGTAHLLKSKNVHELAAVYHFAKAGLKVERADSEDKAELKGITGVCKIQANAIGKSKKFKKLVKLAKK